MSEKQKKNVAVNGAVSQAAGERKQPERVMTNKMGTMPMNRLLLSMALPMMVSMLVQALYNIVDSVFVSMINENALTAVSLAFPIQSLMIALSTGTGVGVNAVLSRSLGERDQEPDKGSGNCILWRNLSDDCMYLFYRYVYPDDL